MKIFAMFFFSSPSIATDLHTDISNNTQIYILTGSQQNITAFSDNTDMQCSLG